MPAYDRATVLANITVPDTQIDGVRSHQNLETLIPNNARNERINLRITGNFVSGAVPGNSIQNRGSILGLIDRIYFNDGGTDQLNYDMRAARFLAEYGGHRNLAAQRVGNATAGQAFQLIETFPLWLTAFKSASPNEMKYVEVNKQAALNLGIIMKRRYNSAGAAGNSAYGLLDSAATGVTVTGVTVSAHVVFDNLSTPPYFCQFGDEVDFPVSQASAQARIDMKGDKYVRGFLILQDCDQGSVGNMISSVILRGDKVSIYGDQGIPWQDLVENQCTDADGDVIGDYSMCFLDFQRQGRITSWWNPNQDTNPRIILNVTPAVNTGAGAAFTNSVVKIMRVGFWPNGACAPAPAKYANI